MNPAATEPLLRSSELRRKLGQDHRAGDRGSGDRPTDRVERAGHSGAFDLKRRVAANQRAARAFCERGEDLREISLSHTVVLNRVMERLAIAGFILS